MMCLLEGNSEGCEDVPPNRFRNDHVQVSDNVGENWLRNRLGVSLSVPQLRSVCLKFADEAKIVGLHSVLVACRLFVAFYLS